MVNLASIVWNQANKTPNQCFINGVDSTYSYDQAKKTISNIAQSLLSKGITLGDRIIIVSPSNPNTLLLFIACYSIGATAVLLHEDSTLETLTHIEKEIQPKIIYFDITLQKKISNLNGETSVLNFPTTQQINNDFQPVKVTEKTPAFIIYTSGSTGTPKGVILSHNNVLFVINAIQQRLNYKAEDIVGLFIPLSFDYGLYQSFLCAQVGATLLLRDSTFTGPVLPSLINKQQLTVLPGLPNLFETLITMAKRRNIGFPSLNKITNTGTHLPENFIEDLYKVAPNAEVYPMYGLTECKRVSILLPEEIHSKPGSCGRPLDGTEAWVVQENGLRVNTGEAGELVVKGPHVSPGYWNSTTENKKKFRTDHDGNALLFTGDHFTQDEDGFLYYVGRIDDQIKRNGFRINKLEIEKAALNISGVQNAALIQSSNKLVLFLTKDDDLMLSSDVMIAMRDKLEPYKVPDKIIFLEKFKETKNGKVDIREMEKLI